MLNYNNTNITFIFIYMINPSSINLKPKNIITNIKQARSCIDAG